MTIEDIVKQGFNIVRNSAQQNFRGEKVYTKTLSKDGKLFLTWSREGSVWVEPDEVQTLVRVK